jgi:hypothetical protein
MQVREKVTAVSLTNAGACQLASCLWSGRIGCRKSLSCQPYTRGVTGEGRAEGSTTAQGDVARFESRIVSLSLSLSLSVL